MPHNGTCTHRRGRLTIHGVYLKLNHSLALTALKHIKNAHLIMLPPFRGWEERRGGRSNERKKVCAKIIEFDWCTSCKPIDARIIHDNGTFSSVNHKYIIQSKQQQRANLWNLFHFERACVCVCVWVCRWEAFILAVLVVDENSIWSNLWCCECFERLT